jgi:hypothetical protein
MIDCHHKTLPMLAIKPKVCCFEPLCPQSLFKWAFNFLLDCIALCNISVPKTINPIGISNVQNKITKTSYIWFPLKILELIGNQIYMENIYCWIWWLDSCYEVWSVFQGWMQRILFLFLELDTMFKHIGKKRAKRSKHVNKSQWDHSKNLLPIFLVFFIFSYEFFLNETFYDFLL